HVLWTKLFGPVPACRGLCRQDSARGKAGRPPGRAADQVRVSHQPNRRQGAPIDDPRILPCPRRRGDRVRRRQFIGLLGSAAAAWPLAAHAQQPAMPVIGFLYSGSLAPIANSVSAFRKGLSEMGYTEGQNVAFEFRSAENDNARLPELAAELVRRQVAVIATPCSPAAAGAAKAATTTIPVVFGTGLDPVQAGLVASLGRPGGNITGVSTMNAELWGKRLGLLLELVPGARRVAMLVNLNSPTTAAIIADVRAVSASLGRQVEIV